MYSLKALIPQIDMILLFLIDPMNLVGYSFQIINENKNEMLNNWVVRTLIGIDKINHFENYKSFYSTYT